ncbi:MAG: hypothetical protein ACR2IE_08610 [Candidatus Sumerlaeaceae bacterium]
MFTIKHVWRLHVAGVLLGCIMCSSLQSAAVTVLSLPAGYTSASVQLGQPYAGALAVDSNVPNRLYASVGFFGSQSILKVDTLAGTTATVAVGFGSVGGMAVLSNGDLALTENGTSQSIYRARDLNADGDFLDPSEITLLIAPILADSGFGFTGAQMTIAPPGNASAMPAGSLVIQTADGGTSAELLVVDNPTSVSPIFRPPGASYFSGLSYNGGVAFDNSGNLIVGESVFPDGRIYGLVNSNSDSDIDAGESHVLVDTAAIPSGIADLAVSQGGTVFFGGNGSGFGVPDAKIYSLQLPANLLTGTGSPSPFTTTNASYLSTLRFDDATKSFAPGATSNPARLFVGGLDSSFSGFSNLLVIRPSAVSAVGDWNFY